MELLPAPAQCVPLNKLGSDEISPWFKKRALPIGNPGYRCLVFKPKKLPGIGCFSSQLIRHFTVMTSI